MLFLFGRVDFLNVSILAFSNICPSILTNCVKFFEGTNQRLDFNPGKARFFFKVFCSFAAGSRQNEVFFFNFEPAKDLKKQKRKAPFRHFVDATPPDHSSRPFWVNRLYLQPANSSNGVYLFLTFLETIRGSPCAPKKHELF